MYFSPMWSGRIGSVCQFPWCKYSYRGWFWASNAKSSNADLGKDAHSLLCKPVPAHCSLLLPLYLWSFLIYFLRYELIKRTLLWLWQWTEQNVCTPPSPAKNICISLGNFRNCIKHEVSNFSPTKSQTVNTAGSVVTCGFYHILHSVPAVQRQEPPRLVHGLKLVDPDIKEWKWEDSQIHTFS